MCQQLRRCLDSDCAVFALDGSAAGDWRERKSVTKRSVLPFGAHEGTGTPSHGRSCWRKRPELGKAPLHGLVGRRHQEQLREACCSLQVCRERIREHQSRCFLLTRVAVGSSLAVAVPCGFWKVVKHWRSQNPGSSEYAVTRICRRKLVRGAPARGAFSGNVCTAGAKSLRHSRRTCEVGRFFWRNSWRAKRGGQSAQQQRFELCCPRRRLSICWRGNRLEVGAPSDGEKLPCQSHWSPQGRRTRRARAPSAQSGPVLVLEADPRHQEILISKLE